MKSITEVTDIRGKYVLVRSSCNVPLVDGVVGNRYRLTRALPTLQWLQAAGAKTILLAHIGRDESDTLRPVYDAFVESIPMQWGGSIGSESLLTVRNGMQDGDIVMVENLRQHAGETANDPAFAAEIAALGDIYVNDAFDNAHREHASMSELAKLLPAYAGLNLIEEVTELEKVTVPTSPSLFLLGGAKFETKMPLVEKYLKLYNHVFIAGALMNDIFKAKGYEVGQSLVSDVSLVGMPFINDPKLILPIDVMVEGPSGVRTCAPDEVTAEERIMDCGPATTAVLIPYIQEAKTVLWNGPFGAYERGFIESTESTAKHLAESSAFSVIGGGDSVAAIEKLGLNDKLGFVSTGGGAMLTFLEHGSTPVLDLLK